MEAQHGRRVLIDMDGVLADFDAAVEKKLLEEVPGLTLFADRTSFYIRDSYPEHEARIATIHNTEGFFRDLPLVEGALDSWQRIIDLGYEPQICSSPLVSHIRCREEKLEWLEKHFVPRFGKTVVEHALITRDKASCEGIALIDDKPVIKNSDRASWRHIVFDRSYNQTATSTLRLHDWNDSRLEELLNAAAQEQLSTHAPS